jgi:hypothetical protein
MAKQVVTTVYEWCDLHLGEDDKQLEAELSETLTFGRLTRNLALCPECRETPKTFVEWIEAFRQYGSKPDAELATAPLRPHARAAAQQSGDLNFCPVESCPRHERPYDSRTGLRDHVRKVHDTTLGVLEGKPAKTEFPCGIDGCKEVPKSAAGLGSHRRSAHGIVGDSKTALAMRAKETASA